MPYIALLKEAPPRTGFLEVEQFRRLRQELPPHLQAPATTPYYAGMKSSELKKLRWSQVNLEAGFLHLDPGTTKNDEGRHVPLNQETTAMLGMLPGDRVGSLR
jgi:integrase